ncbi:MAG TPA: hypothetical protein VM599_08665, partial [Thermoanaerobaculia bacterium]|nr:hypothetical protein [Thermoanaerobaculia bacterium]
MPRHGQPVFAAQELDGVPGHLVAEDAEKGEGGLETAACRDLAVGGPPPPSGERIPGAETLD